MTISIKYGTVENMKYAYENLSPKQFEELVILICQKLLGIAVQGFTEGKDGGRDAKFFGTAQSWPSTTAPWQGKIVIQAKHTNGQNKAYSDSDFFSETANSTIGKELSRIIDLKNNSELTHYMLFTNRKLSGVTEPKVRKHIAEKCCLDESNISLFGVDDLERYLKIYNDIPALADIDPIDSPLIISPDDLSALIEALAEEIPDISKIESTTPTPRTPYERKNTLNSMDKDYADNQRRKYLKETSQISTFLSSPDNLELATKYSGIVDEFQNKILSKRKDYQSFNALLEYLYDLLIQRDGILKSNKKLTRVMLFYMYWHCDIGKNDEDLES